jgi:phosphopantothenoylcysteine decarboxylase/phosphopantothenate--cysteine ligase
MTTTTTILLGVSGSIAAYKACELTRALIQRGAAVHVLMTPHATAFVTPMTFQTLSRNPVTVELFDQIDDWQPEHIALAARAGALVIAPATANVIAKLAHGLADDALTSTALAFNGPVIVAPAMNAGMYQHPATQANLQTLRARGVALVEPDTGELACGTVGVGRLASLAQILAAVERVTGLRSAPA